MVRDPAEPRFSDARRHPGLRLVPADASFADLWWRWRQDAETQRFNPLDDIGRRELASRLSLAGADLAHPGHAEYRWMVMQQNVPIGTVSLSRPSWRMGYGEIGYLIATEHRGRGLGTAAVGMFVDMLFAKTALVRLIATIAEENQASRRLVEHLGFVCEGMLRQHYVIQNRRVNEVIYGLLRDEWLPADVPAQSA